MNSRISLCRPLTAALALLLTLAPLTANANQTPDTVTTAAADPAALAIADQVEQYLFEAVAQQYEGEPRITVTPPAALHGLQNCPDPQVFMPAGRKLRQETTVGVKCVSDSSGRVIYVRANVAVEGTYYVAAQTIGPNQPITQDLLEAKTGDLMALPAHALSTPQQLVGRVATQRLLVGKPIRVSATRSMNSIQRGDQVKVTVRAPGLMITSQGEAMAAADVGAPIQVKTSNGKVIQGVVSPSGSVNVNF